MARGGARENSGPKKDKITLRNLSREKDAEAIVAGLTPLEYMLSVMRDANNNMEVRLGAAKDAAPYVHAKLTSISNTDNKPFKTSLEIMFVTAAHGE